MHVSFILTALLLIPLVGYQQMKEYRQYCRATTISLEDQKPTFLHFRGLHRFLAKELRTARQFVSLDDLQLHHHGAIGHQVQHAGLKKRPGYTPDPSQ